MRGPQPRPLRSPADASPAPRFRAVLVVTQTPPKALFCGELARSCAALCLSLGSVVAYAPEQLTVPSCLRVAASSLATTVVLPLICAACGDATFAPYHATQGAGQGGKNWVFCHHKTSLSHFPSHPGDYDFACPPVPALRALRNAVCDHSASLVRRVLGRDRLVDHASLACLLLAGACVALRAGAPLPASDVCGGMLAQAACCVALATAVKLRVASLSNLHLWEEGAAADDDDDSDNEDDSPGYSDAAGTEALAAAMSEAPPADAAAAVPPRGAAERCGGGPVDPPPTPPRWPAQTARGVAAAATETDQAARACVRPDAPPTRSSHSEAAATMTARTAPPRRRA